VRQRRGALQAINGTGAVVEGKPEMLISAFSSPGTEKYFRWQCDMDREEQV